MPRRILSLNAGSSSLRVAVFDVTSDAETQLASAHVERLEAGGHRAALERCLLGLAPLTGSLSAVSHRIVHGGVRHTSPERLTAMLRSDLDTLVDVAPDHLPAALAVIDAATDAFPDATHVACFDTAFHRDLPMTAAMLPLPRRYWDAGVRRFGFHGLSCEYVMRALATLDPRAASGAVVIAHLGNGASMTAVRNGRTMETTMGFSPVSGLVMGTRSGDIDAGALLYVLRHGMDAEQLGTMLAHESGLVGVSGLSGDMRDLLAVESTEPHAAEAIALFCHAARKALGGLMATLGVLDTLVFTGGIGEHAPTVRQRICGGLAAFGLILAPDANRANGPVISAQASPVTVRVIATDEDRMLARHAFTVLTGGTTDV